MSRHRNCSLRITKFRTYPRPDLPSERGLLRNHFRTKTETFERKQKKRRPGVHLVFISILILCIRILFPMLVYLSLQRPGHAGFTLADFSTLKMEAIRSSETSVHTRSTRIHIPEDGILHSHRRENLRSYLYILFQAVQIDFHLGGGLSFGT
jgi:hypothetical protein